MPRERQTETKTKAQESKNEVIRYVGRADVRQMTKEDWRVTGVDHPAVLWNADNSWQVSVDRLSKQAQRAILADRDFVLVDLAESHPIEGRG